MHAFFQCAQLRIKGFKDLELQADYLQQGFADFWVESFGDARQEQLKALVALASHATALGQQAANVVGELNALLDQ
ncbi:hypothetical protein D3C71_1805440 [compost metagenome]